jgi:TPR repeat protein
LIVSLALSAKVGAAIAEPLEDARAAYEHGDFATAFKTLRLLADQGNAAAQTNLGVMYASGEGVPQSFGDALKWLRKAADQGDAAAQFNLGLLYRDGKGASRNYVQAYMWFDLSAARFPPSKGESRDSALKARDFVIFKLTTPQIAKAQKLAREWKPVSGSQSQNKR